MYFYWQNYRMGCMEQTSKGHDDVLLRFCRLSNQVELAPDQTIPLSRTKADQRMSKTTLAFSLLTMLLFFDGHFLSAGLSIYDSGAIFAVRTFRGSFGCCFKL